MVRDLYRKNEMAFSIVWIVCYVVMFSIADNISERLGTIKVITAPLGVAVSCFLAVWIGKNGLGEKYGLCKVKVDQGKYLYFLPLVLIMSTNLWGGAALRMSVLETVLYIVSMLCAGFMEEVIFRGFLFLAMCRSNVKQAVIISSLTFGIGHIVNLLNGAEVFATLLQIVYAVAIGFLFTVIFYKSKSLIPCIVTHSVVNSLSAVAGERTELQALVTAAVLTVISLAYGVWIWKDKPERGRG